ncbi:hypothetical protein G6F70_001186 [Rhizopus microsporus]|uniref:Uncharacterized protein n=1 Tax=Rhizopus azygosporus TaxID=86630 RepID=A0A367K5G3_RHIAZ|nr:hypothetical protein G6F71_004381 [Rhizopus microsporus]RCH97379.1 hypothetical protein CU097_006627 [Rhizopus azygosporus]KAG1203667.1 hypothetical protein G6F70_001186 [Rhizopus microsporus]KAG1211699.1 hypothetical protein G6F69_004356 [Rhizopus microsporus]KAG1233947.1 hypothetical protein G6F67_003906 [Rhizopus microsporus]
MRFSSFTFAIVYLLGSSLASPVYNKRALGDIGQGVAQAAQSTAQSFQSLSQCVDQGVSQAATQGVSAVNQSAGGDL